MPIQVWLDLPGILCVDAQRIARETQADLEAVHSSIPTRPWIRLVHRGEYPGPKCGADVAELPRDGYDLEIRSAGNGDQYTFDLQPDTARAIFKHSESQRAVLPKDLATSISEVFSGETIAHLLSTLR